MTRMTDEAWLREQLRVLAGGARKREIKRLEESGDEIWLFACPRCSARLGEYCRRPNGALLDQSHVARVSLLTKTPTKHRSQEISGGAFEMNRRRH
jgi:hypothetical protein